MLRHERGATPLSGENDPVLAPFLSATTEPAREEALEGLLVGTVLPLVAGIVGRYRSFVVAGEDAEDVASTVALRFVKRLQEPESLVGGPIERVGDYVARLTFNVIHDLLRRRHPERARLKNRIRYALTHDARLASWETPAGWVAGLSSWRGREPLAEAPEITHDNATSAMLSREALSPALLDLFALAGGPVLIDDIVRTLAPLWTAESPNAASPAPAVSTGPAPGADLEARQYLEHLWSEIQLLPAAQRAALLLNLREHEGGNAVALLVFLGIATLDEVATAVEMKTERLAELWNHLPVDDLTIATHLGVSRQQVINSRKSARERLARRMKKFGCESGTP